MKLYRIPLYGIIKDTNPEYFQNVIETNGLVTPKCRSLISVCRVTTKMSQKVGKEFIRKVGTSKDENKPLREKKLTNGIEEEVQVQLN